MNIPSDVTSSDEDLLRKMVNDLLTKKRVNRRKFFSALQVASEMGRYCSEQCERLTRQNLILQQSNNQLAGVLNWHIQKQENYTSIH